MVTLRKPSGRPAASVVQPKQAETELLLAAAQPATPDQAVRDLLARGPDWPYVLLAAHRHGLLPLLHLALKQHRQLVPDSVSSQLEEHFEANERQNCRVLQEAAVVRQELESAGISAISTRIPLLITSPYGDAGAREYEPFDVLVPPNRARTVRVILAGCGYKPVLDLSARKEALLLRSRPLPMQKDGSLLRLHLQDRLTPAFFPARVSVAGLLDGCAGGDGQSLPSPPAEEVLLLCCLYGGTHIWSKLAWVNDVARIIAFTPDLDWSRVLELAREWGVGRSLLLGLFLAQDLLDQALPEEVSLAIRNDLVVQELGVEVRWRLFNDLRGRLTERERARFRLRSRDKLLDKVRYCASFATTPTPEDWNTIRLPDALSRAFYLLRPLRLVSEELRSRPERAPYYSTPMLLVTEMLALAEVGPEDVVYDLGCGDGRIVIEAAKARGARGVGIDIDPERIEECKTNARAAGVEHLVSFVEGDVLKADLSGATVVTAWMLQTLNLQLRPKLQRELRPGSRIVSHSFDMGDWLPSRTRIVQVGEDSIATCMWSVGGGDNGVSPEPRAQVGLGTSSQATRD